MPEDDLPRPVRGRRRVVASRNASLTLFIFLTLILALPMTINFIVAAHKFAAGIAAGTPIIRGETPQTALLFLMMTVILIPFIVFLQRAQNRRAVSGKGMAGPLCLALLVVLPLLWLCFAIEAPVAAEVKTIATAHGYETCSGPSGGKGGRPTALVLQSIVETGGCPNGWQPQP